MRIFKAETKGLVDDEDESEEPKAITPTDAAATDAAKAEAERRPDTAD